MGNLICNDIKLYNEGKLTYLAKQMMKDTIKVLKKVDDDIFIDATLHDKSTNNLCSIFITQSYNGEIRYLGCVHESDYIGKSDMVDYILNKINKKIER